MAHGSELSSLMSGQPMLLGCLKVSHFQSPWEFGGPVPFRILFAWSFPFLLHFQEREKREKLDFSLNHSYNDYTKGQVPWVKILTWKMLFAKTKPNQTTQKEFCTKAFTNALYTRWNFAKLAPK